MTLNKRFGELLSEGITSVAKRQRKTIAESEQEIADALGYSRHNIVLWRRGGLPKEPEQVAYLVRYCVTNGRVGRDWAQSLLSQTRYPEQATLLEELFPEYLRRIEVPHVYQNLPAPYGDFLGRQIDMARVLEGLASRWPLLSIEGFGGVGKTTLAAETARRCLPGPNAMLDPRFECVVWVSAKDRLQQKRWLNEVFDTIARVLNYPYIAQLPPDQKPAEVDQLLRAQRTLIIVDNFETIEDPDLIVWMQRVPEPSKVLITSRHAQLRTVWDIHLRGLAEPEAMTLILHHARRLGLRAIEAANNDDLLSLVRVTEGNPKAIEMALGHVKYSGISLNEVVDNLYAASEAVNDIFQYLFERAWDSLVEDARHLLLVMPFFADSAGKEALGVATGLKGYHLGATLGQLVEMSLLEVSAEPTQEEQRYSVHPLTRAFAAARLNEVPAWEREARERWISFFLEHVERYGDDDLGAEIGEGGVGHREKLRDEMANLRLAIEWCFQNNPSRAVRLVERITTFLLDEGNWSERRNLCQRALEVAKTPESMAGLLTRLAWSYFGQGDYAQAQEAHKEGIKIARQHNLHDRLVQLLRDSGRLYSELGDYAQAFQLYDESLKLAKEIGQEIGIVQAKEFRARTSHESGNYQQAKQDIHDLLPEFRKSYPRQLLPILRCLGDISTAEGRFEEARAYLREALDDVFHSYYEVHEEAQLYRSWGDLEKSIGHLDAAREAYEKSLGLSSRLGMRKEGGQLEALIEGIEHQLSDNMIEE